MITTGRRATILALLLGSSGVLQDGGSEWIEREEFSVEFRPEVPREAAEMVADRVAAAVEIVEAYGAWLAGCEVPKLFINAEPGSILVGQQREFCRSWPNQREITVKGSHFMQEDSPDEIGEAAAGFVRELRG